VRTDYYFLPSGQGILNPEKGFFLFSYYSGVNMLLYKEWFDKTFY